MKSLWRPSVVHIVRKSWRRLICAIIGRVENKKKEHKKILRKNASKLAFFVFVFIVLISGIFATTTVGDFVEEKVTALKSLIIEEEPIIPKYPPLDKVAYDTRLRALAHLPPLPEVAIEEGQENIKGNTETRGELQVKKGLWPVDTVYPKDGAILPFHRVVAYYGNLYSKKMGVLGEYDEEIMLAKLQAEVDKWNKADPNTPVLPALHYIAEVAQASAGSDGKYKAQMPDKEIDKVLAMAEKINAIVFLDIQTGLSTLQVEVPAFEKYLKMPNVHLGIDPEFYMKSSGKQPGTVIGTMDAADINFVTEYLARLVNENDLPPKILVVHRFTQKMVTNYKNIKTLPEVQIVMNMDGWGGQAHKINTYKQYTYKEPVQFTGFKLFYKNDVKEEGSTLLTPEQLLNLTPVPVYIQYQ